jgi:hypothetical protein
MFIAQIKDLLLAEAEYRVFHFRHHLNESPITDSGCGGAFYFSCREGLKSYVMQGRYPRVLKL